MIKIENDLLAVSINLKGAELQSIYHKQYQLDYLWSGDSAYWGKKSPVLFPIVGGLKNNQYQYQGKTYTLGRHGFARDKTFLLLQQTADSAVFVLEQDEETLQTYPFQFRFFVKYHLNNNQLFCEYEVENTGSEALFFSVGAHPAFKVPLTTNTTYNDWFLEFEKNEDAAIWPLSVEGLIETNATPYLNNTNQLHLSKELFYGDALVFKNLVSQSISIKSHKTTHGLTMHFANFPFYGIWSAKDADFVCLEPWCGIADSVNHTGSITEKEGINSLKPNHFFKRVWDISLF